VQALEHAEQFVRIGHVKSDAVVTAIPTELPNSARRLC
jgi:hypothetical protein